MFDLGDARLGPVLVGSASVSHILLTDVPALCFCIERISRDLVLLTAYAPSVRLNRARVRHQASLVDTQTVEIADHSLVVTLVARQKACGWADTDDQTVSIQRPGLDRASDPSSTQIGPYPAITESADFFELSAAPSSGASSASAPFPSELSSRRDFQVASQTAILGTFSHADEWSSDAYDEWQFDDVRSMYRDRDAGLWQSLRERFLSGGRGRVLLVALLVLCSALLGVTIATCEACVGEDRAEAALKPSVCTKQVSRPEGP
jgi:hypothetical protein